MAFVLVQHLDPAHDSVLASLLARCASLPVFEITDNQRVEPDHIYVIPPNASLAITHGRLRLQRRKDSDQAQRVIDSFLASLAQDQHERAIAVVLSGTASDGTAGLEAIKAEGGITFAQDETASTTRCRAARLRPAASILCFRPRASLWKLARLAKHPFVTGAETPSPGSAARALAVPGLAARPPVREPRRRLPNAAAGRPCERKRASSKSWGCCTNTRPLISRSIGPAPSSAASPGGWC